MDLKSKLIQIGFLLRLLLRIGIFTTLGSVWIGLLYVLVGVRRPRLRFSISSPVWYPALAGGCPQLTQRYWPGFMGASSGHISTLLPQIWRRVPRFVRPETSMEEGSAAATGTSVTLKAKGKEPALEDAKQKHQDADGTNEVLQRYIRVWIEAQDGESLAIDWCTSPYFQTFVGTVIIIPGLNGSSQEGYILSMVASLCNHGYICVVPNHRGKVASLRTSCSYTAAHTGDLFAVANFVQQQWKSLPLFAVGFSLGANILCKFLGELKELKETMPVPKFCAALAISNPYDLDAASRYCASQWLPYDYFMARGLVETCEKNKHVICNHDLINMDVVRESRSVRRFDSEMTVRLHGYRNLDHYYTEGSSLHYLEHVETPLLLVSALDDPVVSPSSIPHQIAVRNPYILLASFKKGGHVHFPEGLFLPRRSLLDSLAPSFLNCMRKK